MARMKHNSSKDNCSIEFFLFELFNLSLNIFSLFLRDEESLSMLLP